MLSFDYTPQFYSPFESRPIRSRPTPQSFGLCSDFFAPSRGTYQCGGQQASPRRIVRSRSYHPLQHYEPRSTFGQRVRSPHSGYDINGLINQLLQQEDQEDAEDDVEVDYKVLRSKTQYQIHINKNNDEFDHYSIRYKIVDGFTMIHIESEKDEFKKVFKFKQADVDVMNVKWELGNNVLKVIVPRVQEEPVVKPHVDRILGPVRYDPRVERLASPSSSRVETQAQPSDSKQSESKPKVRVVSVPIEYEDSETEAEVSTPGSSARSSRSNSISESISDSISTRSRSDSEAELSNGEQEPLHKLPKLKRRVSIEEVEDESF